MESEIPDIYSDSVRFGVGPYGIILEFRRTVPPEPGGDAERKEEPLVRVRMSPQHALIMAKLMLKNVREYEEKIGKISLPAGLYQELGVPED